MKKLKELVAQARKMDNYLIDGVDGEYTAIYFTGNVFTSDEAKNPEHKLLRNNHFDFYKMRIKKASKHILVRDVSEKWYSNGISDELDSIEKVAEFLKEQTKDSKIITIGVSAGGYAACLFGSLLSAKYAIAISAQFQACNEINLPEMLKKSDMPVYYIYPSYSDMDIEHYELVKDIESVKVLNLKSSVHHQPVFKDALKKIINSDINELNKMFAYKHKPIKERVFILKHFGIFDFLNRMVKKNMYLMTHKSGI